MWRSYAKLGHPTQFWVSTGWTSLVEKLGSIPWEFRCIPFLPCKHFYWIKVFWHFHIYYAVLWLHSSSPTLSLTPLLSHWSPLYPYVPPSLCRLSQMLCVHDRNNPDGRSHPRTRPPPHPSAPTTSTLFSGALWAAEGCPRLRASLG